MPANIHRKRSLGMHLWFLRFLGHVLAHFFAYVLLARLPGKSGDSGV